MNGPTHDSNCAPASSHQTESAPAASAVPHRRIRSSELLAGEREILIEHSGETYRLRHTSQGKLILTK